MEKSKPHRIGRFQIVSQLGKGSQGIVYLATDPQLQRQVAIKVLNAKSAGAKATQSNFLQEARTVGRLQHPNIVSIFEAGEHQGIPYLVFEYVDGISLKALIKKKDYRSDLLCHSAGCRPVLSKCKFRSGFTSRLQGSKRVESLNYY